MIDPYFLIQHQSLARTAELIVAHEDVQLLAVAPEDTQALVATEPPPPSSLTIPVPTSPTVPARAA